MATSYGALCRDFYINHKLALKLDLPGDRETILHWFDQVRKAIPRMEKFRRYQGELSLESPRSGSSYQWLALRRTNIRSGFVNPDTVAEAAKFHQIILDMAPYHLSISPIDVDYLEVMMGFDLECPHDHDQIVYDALFAETPVAGLLSIPGSSVMDVQPVFGVQLSKRGDLQAYFEVRTRSKSRRGQTRSKDEPLSIFVTLRKYGPVDEIKELPKLLGTLLRKAEELAQERAIPDLLTPISRQIIGSA